VSLVVYDIAGRVVRTLLERPMAAGYHSEVWDGTDDQGGDVASGLYFCRLSADGHSLTRKMVLLK
jgi:flagellar hook assembly protein FlgD